MNQQCSVHWQLLACKRGHHSELNVRFWSQFRKCKDLLTTTIFYVTKLKDNAIFPNGKSQYYEDIFFP
jgi:hypothetical protein